MAPDPGPGARGRHLAGSAEDWSPTRLIPAGAPTPRPGPNGRGPARRAAAGYPRGSDPDWHPALIERAADIAVAAMPVPLRLLDVGCGSGALLDELVGRVPNAECYVGLEPHPDALAEAQDAVDVRVSLVCGAAESLPFADASFDLVVSTMSLRYWADQRAGVNELARVLSASGTVVIVDAPAAGRLRSAKGVPGLLADAGLDVVGTEVVRRSRLLRPSACAFIASR